MLNLAKFKMRARNILWKIGKTACLSFYYDLEGDVRIKLYYDSGLSSLICYDHFEKAEREFTSFFLREGDIFCDVGANVGLYSMIAAKRVGGNGKVYAFEPGKKMFLRLMENIALNCFSNVVPVRCALSSTNGEASLKVYLDAYDAWSSLGQPSSFADAIEENVPTMTLDTFCAERKLDQEIVMMKIDVEGWEQHVLQGAVKLLSADTAPLLLIEFAEECARNAGSSCQELYHLVRNYGYTLYRYNAPENRLIEEKTAKNYSYVNLICIKSATSKQRVAKLLMDN
jgi:FkbM family methyltransferase